MATRSANNSNASKTVSVCISVAVVIALLVMLFAINASVELGDTSFTLKCPTAINEEISYSSVQSASLVSNFNGGSKSFGFNTSRINAGKYNNAELGDYFRCAYTASKSVIVVKADGKFYAFTAKTTDETNALWQQLKTKLPDSAEISE